MKKLIIIEEDTDAREMLAFTFENNGFEVIQYDKAITVEDAAQLKPHILIIDYMVNGVPGNDFCVKLKADEHTQNIPVILYSASLTVDQVSKNSSADGVFAKPLGLEDLIYLVHRISLS